MSEIEELKLRVQELENKVCKKITLMGFRDTMEYLGFSRSYLARLCYRKKIPFHKPTARRIFFVKEEVDEWVCSRSHQSAVISRQSSVGS